MQQSIVFSNHVINTIKALPIDERRSVVNALTSEIFMDESSESHELSPMEEMICTIIRFYVKQDSMKLMNSLS